MPIETASETIVNGPETIERKVETRIVIGIEVET
jgi:hypothetical protein